MEDLSIKLKKPDDWHVHLRETDILTKVLPFTYESFGSALVMPNLERPVTNIHLAEQYYQEICKRIPKDVTFTPYMTIYLSNNLDVKDIRKISMHKNIKAVKMYPKGATTNSEFGISDILEFYPLFEEMEKTDVTLCIHGEVTDEKVDVFDREKVFIDTILTQIVKNFPDLNIVLEHITSKDAVKFIEDHNSLAATITVHHLLVNRNIMLSKGIRPDYYCAPILKTEDDRCALVNAAVSGKRNFFLGTDSAPHLERKKISACGCAGIFTSPLAIPLLIQLFEEHDSLSRIENFVSINGRKFYGVKQQTENVTYVKRTTPVKTLKNVDTNEGKVVVFNPVKKLYWEKLR
jgi:dihydroorotase